jgi:DegV family protein with EDD domain
MGNIAIVSCTSADLTPQQAKDAGVTLVPLKVSFGDETWDTVTELSNEEFYQKLTAPGAPFPKTAAVNPAQFEEAFRNALDAGAEAVVCVTISSAMSATYAAAVQAAEAFEAGVVQVVDSRTVTQPQGIIVRRAADLAATGAGQAEIVDLCHDLAGRSRLNFTPNTLEYLQKGGRIGRASALVGSLLSIKPILGVDEDGVVISVDRKRTAAKARERLLEIAGEASLEQVAVLHTGADDVEQFADQVAEATGVPRSEIEIILTGPVAGAHVGPDMVGVTRILAG